MYVKGYEFFKALDTSFHVAFQKGCTKYMPILRTPHIFSFHFCSITWGKIWYLIFPFLSLLGMLNTFHVAHHLYVLWMFPPHVSFDMFPFLLIYMNSLCITILIPCHIANILLFVAITFKCWLRCLVFSEFNLFVVYCYTKVSNSCLIRSINISLSGFWL